jgi:hypothetical protein
MGKELFKQELRFSVMATEMEHIQAHYEGTGTKTAALWRMAQPYESAKVQRLKKEGQTAYGIFCWGKLEVIATTPFLGTPSLPPFCLNLYLITQNVVYQKYNIIIGHENVHRPMCNLVPLLLLVWCTVLYCIVICLCEY